MFKQYPGAFCISAEGRCRSSLYELTEYDSIEGGGRMQRKASSILLLAFLCVVIVGSLAASDIEGNLCYSSSMTVTDVVSPSAASMMMTLRSPFLKFIMVGITDSSMFQPLVAIWAL